MYIMKYTVIKAKKGKDMIWMDQKVLSQWFILGETYWQLELTLLLLGFQKKYGTYFGEKADFEAFENEAQLIEKHVTLFSQVFLYGRSTWKLWWKIINGHVKFNQTHIIG